MLNPTLKNRPQHAKKGDKPRVAKGSGLPGSGRQRGSKNKMHRSAGIRTIEQELAATKKKRGDADDTQAAKLTPLDFCREVLRTPSKYPFAARSWAATTAMPYLHKKLPVAQDEGPAPEDAAAMLREKLAAMEAVTIGEAPPPLIPPRKKKERI